MADLFYLPYYIDDYEAATAHLTPEEDGIYMRLIRLCWRTPGCTIPNDIDWIARKMRMPNEQTKIQPLLEEFFKLKNNRFYQKKLLTIYSSKMKTLKARKEAGKSGGEAKALNLKKKQSNKDKDLLEQNPSKPLAVKARVRVKDKAISKDRDRVNTLTTTKDKKVSGAASAPGTNGKGTSSLVWEAYSFVYEKRYGVLPVRNVKVNSQIVQFIKRVPESEAPMIAAFYVTSPNRFYLTKGHSIGCLLADAEKIRTEAITGKFITSRGAYEADSKADRFARYAGIIEKFKEEERGRI